MPATGPIDTPIGTMWIDEDGVLWHRLREGVSIDLADAMATREAVAELVGDGDPVPAIVDMRGAAFAERSARFEFALSADESHELATALLVGPATSRALAGLFLRFSTPQRPVETFDNEAAALAWLRTFL